ncbi:MAG: tetratricopeptide repeat protein [bacterium]|nr:tetratricopeptide repeat protein [bacterium]
MITKRTILSIERNKTLALCTLAIILVTAFYTYRSGIGWIVWKYFHTAPVATVLNPNDAELQFEIGNYYFGGGLPAAPWRSAQAGAYDIEKAQSYFEKALEINPDIQGAHYQLGRTYFIQSGFADALREINKEIELHPDFKRSYYMRGLIYGYTKHYAEAESDFKEFLKWKPESWAGHNDLAWIYFQEGKYKETTETAREGLKIVPDNPWLLNSLGVALLNTGEKNEAKETFAKTLAILDSMSPKDWGMAYPGNNPQIYGEGLSKMKQFIQDNLKLLSVVNN